MDFSADVFKQVASRPELRKDRLSPGERILWSVAFERALGDRCTEDVAVRRACVAVLRLRIFVADGDVEGTAGQMARDVCVAQ